ncbi:MULTISPECIES: hypothetical protein [Mycolicibacterium]|uniref:hypothetical protein n=1 Tax=Mycolicibacterium TaxID=1866885 RepID=UPI002636CB2E|nr:hypothetical protein [Mycolicibacterium fortuitum]
MPRYEPIWLEIAREQYTSLPSTVQQQIDDKLSLILEDPERYGSYDKPSDQWTTDFGDGAGLIVYAVVHENVKVIVLRLI